MKRGGAVYILTNSSRKSLYCGVTENLQVRIQQHKSKFFEGSFTDKYNVDKLVYYEVFHSIEEAIMREKQIKAGSRKKKEQLIGSMNPEWKDLYEVVMEW